MNEEQTIIMEYYNENRDKFDDIECHIGVVCDHRAPDPNTQGFNYNDYKPIILSDMVDMVREAQFWDGI